MRKILDKQSKIMESNQKYKVTCKCGHRLFLPPLVRKKICDWCGKLNYANKKIEFEEKIKLAIRKR